MKINMESGRLYFYNSNNVKTFIGHAINGNVDLLVDIDKEKFRKELSDKINKNIQNKKGDFKSGI